MSTLFLSLLLGLLLFTSLPSCYGDYEDDDNDLCPISYYTNETANEVCMMFEALITLEITYDLTNTSLSPLTSTIQLVNCSSTNFNISNQSYCGSRDNSTKSKMVVDFSNNVTLSVVAMPVSSKQWNISEIMASINVSASLDLFPHIKHNNTGIIEGYTKKNENLFGTLDYGKYYRCNTQRSYDLVINTTGHKNDSSILKMKLTISQLSILAFNTHGNFNKSKHHECYQDHSGKAFIPIVVGSVIGGLVLVVLVSYIVGRFRNHHKSKSGYEKL